MLRTRYISLGAFDYEEKYYGCGYKFTLNVAFDKKVSEVLYFGG